GSSKGFGHIWAEAALARGDRVAATARNTDTVKDLVDTYGDNVLPIALDVTDKAAVDAAVNRAHDHFGRLDVVVNNAGFGLFGAGQPDPGLRLGPDRPRGGLGQREAGRPRGDRPGDPGDRRRRRAAAAGLLRRRPAGDDQDRVRQPDRRLGAVERPLPPGVRRLNRRRSGARSRIGAGAPILPGTGRLRRAARRPPRPAPSSMAAR